VNAYSDSLQLTRARLDGGVSPESDVAQAKTPAGHRAGCRLPTIAVQRAQYEHAIAVLIGKPPASFALAAAPLDSQPPAVSDWGPLRAARTPALTLPRPSAAPARRTSRSAIAIAAYYPSLSLNGSGQDSRAARVRTWFNWPSRLWAVGPFFGGRPSTMGGRAPTPRQKAAACAQYDAVIADYRQTTLTAFSTGRGQSSGVEHPRAGSPSSRTRAVESAKNNLRLFTDRYVGWPRQTTSRVITAQTAYLDNERNQVEIRRRRMDATVLLVKALGGRMECSGTAEAR